MCADDLGIYSIVKNVNTFNIKLNELFNLIQKWCNYSGAKVSEEKSKHLHM